MAQGDDIRVRLSAEGVADVVAALRKVQKEAGDANRKTSALLKEIKQEFGNLLPALGFAAVATGFAALVKGAADFADEVGKAGVRTGSSAENFSVLAFAAKTADVEFGDLQNTLIRFARNLDEVRAGTATAEVSEAFRDLNLAAKDFEGLDTAQAFALLSERLVGVEDGTKRARLAIELLGRSGAAALTLIQDLGEKGFREVAKDAEAAGAIISADLATAAAAANDSMTAMGIVTQGLALQFVAGLAPSVNTALTSFREDVQGKGTTSVKSFGEATGRVVRVIVAGFTLIGNVAGTVFTLVGKHIAATVGVLGALFTGEFAEAKSIMRQYGQDVRSELTDAFENFANDWEGIKDAATSDPIKIKVAPVTDKAPLDETARDIQQQLQQRLAALQKQSGEGEIKTLIEAARRRRALTEESLKLDQERAQSLLAMQQHTLQGQQQLANAESQILAARVRAVTEAYQAERGLIEQRAAVLSAAAQKQYGDGRANAQLQTQIARQATAEQLTLAQKHYGDLARLQGDYLARYRASQETIKAIDKEVADNRAQRERTFKDIARSRLSEEEQLADRMREAQDKTAELRAAVLSGDLENARKLRQEVNALAADIARANSGDANANARFGERLAERADELLNLALSQKKIAETANKVTAEKGLRSLSDQLKEAAEVLRQFTTQQVQQVRIGVDDNSLRETVREIADKLNREPYLVRIAPQVQGAAPAGFAFGGRVPGISAHARADDKLVRVTSGEFIHNVRAVRHYGVEFMRDVNAMRLPRIPQYAEGGLIGTAPAGAPDEEVTLNLNINGQGERRVRGSRDTVRALVRDLRDVSRGTVRQ